jgi:DNA gyrase subunit A
MFDLRKAQDRAHVLEGLKIAIENIDNIVPLLKNSKNIEDAKNSLMKNYSLSEVQSKSILEMKISKLVSLERQKLIDEFNSLLKTILELKEILADDKKIFAIIKTELSEISARYGDFRRTEIIEGEDDLDFEDLIPNEETVIMITNRGYIKRVPLEEYKSQKRGGVGVIGIETKEQDDIDDILITKTHNYLLFFTDKGKIHWLKTYRIPEAGRYSAGKAIVNLLELSDNSEKITSWVSVKEFNENEYLSMITKNGIIKRSSLMDYSNPRKGGIIGINLRENDQLVSVLKTTGKESILIATKNGLAIRFDELDAREIGRTGMGVIGIRFKENDYVVSATICNKPAILTITENGYGKRTPIDEYRIQGRGGHGVINIKTEGRNGKVIGAKAVEDTDQVIVISSKGQVIRTSVSNISQVGRNTMGVKILRLKEGEVVANFAVIKSELIKDEIKEEKIEELPDSTENN